MNYSTLGKIIYITIGRLGNRVNRSYKTIHAIFSLALHAIQSIFSIQVSRSTSLLKQVIRQTLFTGVEAFGIVSVVALLCGITIVIQATTNMPNFGVSEYFGNLLVVIVIRELCPFFTSLIVIGRSGAALATYIGNMRVSKEILALEIMGIDPIRFIVMPSFLGFIISTICLSTYFAIIAVIGGLLVAQAVADVPFEIFLAKVVDALGYADLITTLMKSLVFGGIIAIVSAYYGLNVSTIRGVPQAALKAVVVSMISTIIINILVTLLTYAY